MNFGRSLSALFPQAHEQLGHLASSVSVSLGTSRLDAFTKRCAGLVVTASGSQELTRHLECRDIRGFLAAQRLEEFERRFPLTAALQIECETVSEKAVIRIVSEQGLDLLPSGLRHGDDFLKPDFSDMVGSIRDTVGSDIPSMTTIARSVADTMALGAESGHTKTGCTACRLSR